MLPATKQRYLYDKEEIYINFSIKYDLLTSLKDFRRLQYFIERICLLFYCAISIPWEQIFKTRLNTFFWFSERYLRFSVVIIIKSIDRIYRFIRFLHILRCPLGTCMHIWAYFKGLKIWGRFPYIPCIGCYPCPNFHLENHHQFHRRVLVNKLY